MESRTETEDLNWEKTGDAVTFTLLGPLEVRLRGRDYAPTTPKQLQVLATLLTRPGKIVPMDAIVEELWGDHPPRRARTTIQTYIYQLRKCIERHGLAPNAEELLATRHPGYAFMIDPAQTDVFEFARLSKEGQSLLQERRYVEAARTFRAALALWSGPALTNVNCGSVLFAYTVGLQEQKRSIHHLRIQAEIEGGVHRELIGELRSMTTENPLDEGLHGQLMQVLCRSGRRSDAMATYRQLRFRLHTELGVEP
jgi:DNA-binding SARP family transcriptional activator